jgi:hypothetical protein
VAVAVIEADGLPVHPDRASPATETRTVSARIFVILGAVGARDGCR